MSSGQVLHLDLISLAPAAGAEGQKKLLTEAAALSKIESVIEVRVIEGDAGSDHDLALLFLLPELAALEPFGTDGRYVRFLQGTVAPALRAFAGADVQLEAELPPLQAWGACLALAAPAATYDWEIRERLGAWALRQAQDGAREQAGETAIGLAAGERQRYRGVAIVFGAEAWQAARPEAAGFESTLVFGRATRLVPVS